MEALSVAHAGTAKHAGSWVDCVFGFSDHAEYDAKLMLREHELRRGDKYFSRVQLLQGRLAGLQEVAVEAQASMQHDLQSLLDAVGEATRTVEGTLNAGRDWQEQRSESLTTTVDLEAHKKKTLRKKYLSEEKKLEEEVEREVEEIGERYRERIRALEEAHQGEVEALEEELLAQEREHEREWEEKQERLLQDLVNEERDMLLRFEKKEQEMVSQVAELMQDANQ